MRQNRINPIGKKTRERMANLRKIPPPIDGLCQECHQKPDFRGLVRHHIRMRSRGGDEGIVNIKWLCGKCHSLVHGIKEG